MTLTFGDQAENHTGMEVLGNAAESGFSHDDLKNIQKLIGPEQNKYPTIETELIDLRDLVDVLPEGCSELEGAYVLILRGFLNKERADGVLKENMAFEWDKKLWNSRQKKVQNKHARHNVCYGAIGQESDFENGKGTIIPYNQVPLTNEIIRCLPQLLGEKGEEMVCEGNLYFDIKKTGIGWHGDTERKKVFGVRCGATIPLCFRWWYKNASFGETLKIDLCHGDAYIMSEKAVGSDWKRSSIPTLRHSAGSDKYTKVIK